MIRGTGVQVVGIIKFNKLKLISDNPDINEIIITNERIKHINDNHPNDYDRYSGYLSDIFKEPDYIITANRPNTAVLLKEVADKEKVQVVIRLSAIGDPEGYKNSVLTLFKVRDKEWNRLIRNKKIIYKSE